MLRKLIPFVLLILLLTGCVRQHVDITVHPDGSQVDIDMIAAADSEWAKREGINIEAQASEKQPDASGFSDHARWEKWSDGKWVGQHLIAPNTPIENVTNGGLLTLANENDRWTFSTSPLQLGWGAQSSNFEDVVNSEADLRFRVKLPGKVEETNGQLEGEWVVWTTRDANLETFSATTSVSGEGHQGGQPVPSPSVLPVAPDDSGTPLWVWLVGLVVSLIVGLGVFSYLGKRK